MNELKERLVLLRGESSREDFAIIVEVKPTTWRNYELGSTLPNSDVLLMICKKLNIAPLWLLMGEGPMHPNNAPNTQEFHDKTSTVKFEAIALCPRCTKLEAELELEKTERRDVSAENRRLWKENGELRERCATLTERMACSNSGQ